MTAPTAVGACRRGNSVRRWQNILEVSLNQGHRFVVHASWKPATELSPPAQECLGVDPWLSTPVQGISDPRDEFGRDRLRV